MKKLLVEAQDGGENGAQLGSAAAVFQRPGLTLWRLIEGVFPRKVA